MVYTSKNKKGCQPNPDFLLIVLISSLLNTGEKEKHLLGSPVSCGLQSSRTHHLRYLEGSEEGAIFKISIVALLHNYIILRIQGHHCEHNKQ